MNTKRWNHHTIRKTAHIFNQAESQKSIQIKILEELAHWLILFVILFGNVMISAFVVVLSEIVNNTMLYFITAVFGIGFGLLIEMPLRDIEKLDSDKHFISRIMFPVLALVNIYILAGLKSFIGIFTEITYSFNPLLVGLCYGIFLLLPHYSFLIKKGVAGEI